MWSLRRAVRVIVQAPLVAVAIVLLTSVGMASVLSIFGPLYSLILSPLPLPEADRLVRLGGGVPLFNSYTSRFVDVDRVRPVFSHIAAYAPTTDFSNNWRLPSDERIQSVLGLAVTPEFFETLNVAPRLGRSLLAWRVGDTPGVVISDRLWRTRFEGRKDALGTPVNIGGRAYVIIGVMPAAFSFSQAVDAWMPMGAAPYGSGLEIIGRLGPDVSLSRASEWLEAFKRAESPRPDGQFRASGPTLQRLGDYLRGDTRNTLLTLFAASWALVLLSCVGVVNLLLARSADRKAEVAVQLALGASRGRLVRQCLLETSALVAVGALVGLWLSHLGRRWLDSQLPDLPIEWPLTPISMAAIVGLIALVTLLSGLAPALYATRPGRASLVAGTSVTFSAQRRLSLIEVLAASQLALAVGLLTGAVLLGRSLYLQVNTPLGFTPENVLSFRTALARSSERLAAEAAYQKNKPTTTKALHEWARAKTRAAKPQIAAEYQRSRAFLQQLTERLASLPGVTAVGVLSPTPFSEHATSLAGGFSSTVSSQAGPNTRDKGEKVQAIDGYVSQTGFEVLGVRLLAGRPFSAADIEDAFQSLFSRIGEANTPHPPYPAIVNDALARRIWGDANPVGQYFNTYDHEQSFQVVGVVANFQWTPGVPIDRPAVYRPFDRAGLTADMVVKVRPEAQISALLREIDATVIALAPDASHVQIQGLDEMVSAAQHDLRVVLTLLGCFATVGIVVASLGIFTAASLLIRSTTRELGIRLALGASPARIRWALLLRIGGTLLGLPAGWFLGWCLVS